MAAVLAVSNRIHKSDANTECHPGMLAESTRAGSNPSHTTLAPLFKPDASTIIPFAKPALTIANDSFSNEVLRLRADHERRRVATNLFPPGGRPLLDLDVQRGVNSCMTFWFDDGTRCGQCVRIFDVPHTLSGDILRLRRNVPSRLGHFEIDGSDIRPLDRCLEHPEPVVDDSEAAALYREIRYLPMSSRCSGGLATGSSSYEKLSSSACTLGRFSSLAVYKRWILQLIDARECLHSLGIVHRDLRAANLLFSHDGERLVVCDLESRWGEREAPEVAFEGGPEDSGWTPSSDMFDVGNCIKSMVYANAPITHFVEWPVPPPLQAIVEACMRLRPKDRPTLADLRIMVRGSQT